MKCKLFLILAGVVLLSNLMSFAQTIDDKQEMREELKKIKPPKPALPFEWSATGGVFSGYDSNVNLSPTKKGDLFQEGMFSAAVTKPLFDGLRFSVNYDFDYINYDHMTDASNMLNHVNLKLSKEISAFDLATGFDFSSFYYPKDENGTFLMYKCFASVRQYLNKRWYHQLRYDAVQKIHTDRKALAETITTYQNKELESRRHVFEYSTGSKIFRDLFANIKARFTINDSNAKYLNFYDYKTYEVSPSISYNITRKINLYTDFRYARRNYKSRIITTGTDKEEDDLYTTNTELRYKINKNNIISLIYTYRNNASNEPLEEYTENVVSAGWQYNF